MKKSLCKRFIAAESDTLVIETIQTESKTNRDVDVIGPTGFDMTDRALRRAGLDYLAAVDLARHVSLDAFLANRGAGRLVLLTTRGSTAHTAFAFEAADTLLLGRESAGVPERVHTIADATVAIPMATGLRSLNIAVAAAIALGEALRQTDGFPPIAVTNQAP